MKFLLADTFQAAMARLTNAEQKAVKLTVFDLQQDPSAPGLKFHRIDKSKDPHFWSLRVNRDIRLIVHKTRSSFLIVWVGRHDEAYKWAMRRRIDTHPRTGAAQLVEIRERVEEIASPRQVSPAQVSPEDSAGFLPPLFLRLSHEDLRNIGVPEDWLEDVHNASEDSFLQIMEHIPAEVTETLFNYIATGHLQTPQETFPEADPFAHPDAQRRFRVMDNIEELKRALDYPWDKWAVYLHPAQQKRVDAVYSGPVRIAGSAGTGKTVVALHRAAHILRSDKNASLLLTTFSSPLSNALEHKLKRLLPDEPNMEHRVSIRPFEGIARELFILIHGYEPRPARKEHVAEALQQAASELKFEAFTDRFLMSEWRHVIDAWQIDSLDAYARVPRIGRKNRLGSRQREKLWPVLERTRAILTEQSRYTPATIFGKVAAHYRQQDSKPFTCIIVDEAQDMGVPELKMIAAMAPDAPEALFFAGDLGQRIFQEPFSWLGLGIDVRGRSHTLKVNYRTSHQIRRAADGLLPSMMRDVDGIEEDRTGTVSVFNGPEPEIILHANRGEEIQAVILAIYEAVDEGMPPEEIGIFVRSRSELSRAREAVEQGGQTPFELSGRVEDRNGRISIGTMHLAKGLEFRLVIVMACDEETLPDQGRMHSASDEAELDEAYETERHLFYVACTRAREKLIVSGVVPASEFLADLRKE